MDTIDSPKKSVNLSLNADLVRLAKSLGLDLSALPEEAVAQAVKASLGESWLRDNDEAIRSCNERVTAHGVFSDGFRSF